LKFCPNVILGCKGPHPRVNHHHNCSIGHFMEIVG
jgi:hypothetical protein